MSQERDNALAKVKSARLFLELMKRVEDSKIPLVRGNTPLEEYTSYLDGYWNACYSATHYFDDTDPNLKTAFAAFRKITQGDFYANKTGKRSIAVHHKPVEPKREGYMPPRGDQVNFELKEYDPPNGDQVNFDLKDYYYFTGDPSERPITRQCEAHLAELENFIKKNCP